MNHVIRNTFSLPLLSLLLIFTLLTLYQSITLPLGEADDETDHYQYLRFVARTGHPPFNASERKEAGFKGGLAPLYYWLTAWPIALVGETTLPDIRRVDARPERLIPGDGLRINHVLHTLDEQWPWRGQVLAWHLVRFLSLPMAWLTIIATYALAKRLIPQPPLIALGAAAFVAFLPRFVSSSAVVNDDNLVFALTSLLLLIQVIILQSPSPRPRLFALMGLLCGLALMTKYFSLILLPEILFTLLASRKIAPPPTTNTPESRITIRRSPFAIRHSPFIFLLTLLLTAGPWFLFITLRFNRITELGFIPGLAAALGEPQITEGLVGLLSGQSVRPVAATYGLLDWLGLLYRSFWFEFGWMQLFAPTWAYSLFSLFLLLALAGHILRRAYSVSPHTPYGIRHTNPITLLLLLHFALFLSVVLARYVLSATIDTGQGRHLYPALPVIALFISLGLTQLGFWLLDLAFRALPFLATQVVPTILRWLPSPQHLQFLPSYLLFAIFYLLPALFVIFPSAAFLAPYAALPITQTAPAKLPISYRSQLQFGPGLFLAGFDLAKTKINAGDALPVTLYWRAEQEAQQDYLLSLCLQDPAERPVACWRGHFANGHYPARAWESGDTVIDSILIPIPVCYRLTEQSYHLRLEVWPLQPGAPAPQLAQSPVLRQTFSEPAITLHPTDSRLNRPQTVELWSGRRRPISSIKPKLNEALTWLSYATANPATPPTFVRQIGDSGHTWSPLSGLDTPLYLPCDDGPSPFAYAAHFIASPNLPSGPYLPTHPQAPPNLRLALDLRQRQTAPLTATLAFSATLAPLSLQLANLPPLHRQPASPPARQPATLPSLPITIRWQTQRWMADPLIISLKLLDKDFQVGGERVATLGDRYPNVLWMPGEIVEETYPLRLKLDAPPGLYRLELSLLRQDPGLPDGFEYLPLRDGETTLGNNSYPLTIRLLDPADGSPPPNSFSAQLGDSIQLIGYNLTPQPITHPQSPISLALYWRSIAPIATDYTVFTQLIGPDGQLWAQWDNPPQAGRYPTSAWAAQDQVVDRYSLTLRPGAPPGQYRLLIGMYNPITGQRLPATINGQPQFDNALEIEQLSIINEQ